MALGLAPVCLLALAGRLRAPASLRPRARIAASSSAPSDASFLSWAESSGVKLLAPLALGEFDGVRGVGAAETIGSGAAVISVPSKLALQTTTTSPCPGWCDGQAWTSAKWDARLAMTLLHEKSDPASALRPWLDALPSEFSTPVLWSQSDALAFYPHLAAAIDAQRQAWKSSRLLAPGSPSEAEWAWAMSVVRSLHLNLKYMVVRMRHGPPARRAYRCARAPSRGRTRAAHSSARSSSSLPLRLSRSSMRSSSAAGATMNEPS